MAEKNYRRQQGTSPRQWRNFLVNRNLQLRIIFTNLIYMLLIIIATLAVQFSPLLQDMYLSGDIEVQYQAAQIFLPLLQRFLPAVVVMFILIFLHQMLFTHRIFGPLVNFAHTFDKMSQGDLTRKVRLRKGDFLDNETEKINRMNDSINQHIRQSRQDIDQLVEGMEKLLKQAQEQDREQLLASLAEIHEQAVAARRNLSVFKTRLD